MVHRICRAIPAPPPKSRSVNPDLKVGEIDWQAISFLFFENSRFLFQL